jgi:hypothetical protein
MIKIFYIRAWMHGCIVAWVHGYNDAWVHEGTVYGIPDWLARNDGWIKQCWK